MKKELETFLTPIEEFRKPKNNSSVRYLKCRCVCGSIKEVREYDFRKRIIRSCGCYSSQVKRDKYSAFKNSYNLLPPKLIEEEWYFPLYDYYSYYVSASGKYYSTRTDTILKQHTSKKGYLRVRVKNREDKYVTLFSHRGVAKTFLLNPLNKEQVNHIDANKENNCVSNLEWVSNQENCDHKVINNLQARNKGEKCGTSKLKNEQVKQIFLSESTTRELASQYNVSTSTILLIKERKAWSHVTKNLRKVKSKRNDIFNDDEVVDIYTSNLSYKQLALKYDKPISTIKAIKNDYNFTHITKNLKKGHSSSLLLEEDVVNIFKSKETYAKIGMKYNISISAVSAIKNKRNYTQYTDKL